VISVDLEYTYMSMHVFIFKQKELGNKNRQELEMRSVERGSCPIALSAMNDLFL